MEATRVNWLNEITHSPRRGDIWFVEPGGGVVGSEMAAGRPAVVVSNDKANKYSPVVEVVYCTTRTKKAMPTHVPIKTTRHPSTALCEQIVAVSKERLTMYIGMVTEDERKNLDAAMAVSLGLEDKMEVMEVKIKNDAGENVFALAPEKVPVLLSFASWLESEPAAGIISHATELPAELPHEDEPTGPAENSGQLASNRHTNAGSIVSKEGYKGFLLVECRHCGKRKGFCAKKRITASWCDCGKYTPLENMVPVFLNCKCGCSFKYMTNITAQRFEYNCLACGSPVDLVLNKRQTAYVTMGEQGEQ